jgi:hypothetical protein
MRGITKKQFAAQQGVSPARVSQWVKNKIIFTLPDGSIDPVEGERDLLKNRDASKRVDWEYRIKPQKHNHPRQEGPPHPFTGNIARDFMIMGLIGFYDFFLQKMIPLHLTLFRDLHVEDRSAKGMAVCFAFKTHDLIKEFVEKDLFKRFFLEQTREDIDPALPIGGKKMKTFPPKNFNIEHPKVVKDLLGELGSAWPFEDEKKVSKKKK